MLAPIFSDPAFNQGLMDTQHKLRDAVAKGASAVSISQTTAIPPATFSAEPSKTAPPVSEKSSNTPSLGGVTQVDSEDESTNKESQNQPESTAKELSLQEERYITTLQEIDRRVRAHEQAHLNAAQGLAVSRANFSYEVGPDEKRYAIAGEVTIDTSEENEPEKTIDKGYHIIRTALAPADPSPQDRSVANNAQMMIQEAQAELIRESYEQNQSSEESQSSGQQIDQLI